MAAKGAGQDEESTITEGIALTRAGRVMTVDGAGLTASVLAARGGISTRWLAMLLRKVS